MDTPIDRLTAITTRLNAAAALAAELAEMAVDPRVIAAQAAAIEDMTAALEEHAENVERIRAAIIDLGAQKDLLVEGALAPLGDALNHLFPKE